MGTKGGKKLAQSQHQRREMHNILLSSITTHVRLNTGKKLYSLKVLTCAYTINVNNKKEKKSLIFLCYLSYRLHISNSHWKKLHHTAVLLGLLQVMTLYRLLLSCYYCFSCVIFFLEIECLFVYLKNNQIFLFSNMCIQRPSIRKILFLLTEDNHLLSSLSLSMKFSTFNKSSFTPYSSSAINTAERCT